MTRIEYFAIQEIHQAPFVNLLLLVDEEHKRQLVVVTDKPTAMNIAAMHDSQTDPNGRELFFKRSALYVLLSLLPAEMKRLMYIHIDQLVGGQYCSHLVRRNADINEPRHDLRISEAILLSISAGIPIYIDDHLWHTQSTKHDPKASGTTIPANTLPLPMLKQALQQAIDNEEYEMAKVLNDEIHNRFPGELAP